MPINIEKQMITIVAALSDATRLGDEAPLFPFAVGAVVGVIIIILHLVFFEVYHDVIEIHAVRSSMLLCGSAVLQPSE